MIDIYLYNILCILVLGELLTGHAIKFSYLWNLMKTVMTGNELCVSYVSFEIIRKTWKHRMCVRELTDFIMSWDNALYCISYGKSSFNPFFSIFTNVFGKQVMNKL